VSDTRATGDVELLDGPPPHPLRTLLTGMAMGAADVVPGFSGGTVALIGGIYPRVVGNARAGAHVLSALVRLRVREVLPALRAIEWTFLVPMLLGVLGAIFALAGVLEDLLASQPIVMSAVFLGLVLGAAVVARRQLRAPVGTRAVLIGVAVALVTFVVLGARPATLVDPSPLVIAAAGAVAICAMILPGVSGSFVLLLLGVYEPIIAAVSARDLATLLVLAGGIVVGLAAFSTLLNWLLRRHHDLVLVVLIGIMVGSARVLWPWPSAAGVGDPTLAVPGVQLVPATLAALVAFAAVVLVDRLVGRLDRSRSAGAA
jgi:putative membrane protein